MARARVRAVGLPRPALAGRRSGAGRAHRTQRRTPRSGAAAARAPARSLGRGLRPSRAPLPLLFRLAMARLRVLRALLHGAPRDGSAVRRAARGARARPARDAAAARSDALRAHLV